MQKDESELEFKITGKSIKPERPEPILANLDVVPFNQRMDTQIAVEALLAGHHVLIVDLFSSGLALLSALGKYLKKKYHDQSFKGQREFRSAYRELSCRVVLIVREHKLTVKKAPKIGWLKILYPELTEFLLPFSQVQGLNSSWQSYENGISFPVIENKIHPWFGTYFPSRFEHLSLFDHWLKHYKGEKKSAIDVGAGCGILTFQLLKYGFEKVIGTDTNANALIGLNEDLSKNNLISKVDLIHGDLFANCDFNTELIVFNPPWLPATYDIAGLDTAIYYDDKLFPRFFAEAEKHLKPGGRLVLLFSNLAQITKASESHPIELELAEGGRFRKEYFQQKKVAPASNKTKRNQHWRSSEMVELWVLKLIDTEEIK